METKEFNKLTKAQKRVVIAQDVLAQIESGFYKPKTERFTDLKYKEGFSNDFLNNKNVKENLDKVEKCKVCAIGSCLMSITAIKNNLNFEDISETSDFYESIKIKGLLGDAYSPTFLMLLESAFETNFVDSDFVYYSQESLGAKELTEKQKEIIKEKYHSIKKSKKRLIAIMQNIIDNNGEFVL